MKIGGTLNNLEGRAAPRIRNISSAGCRKNLFPTCGVIPADAGIQSFHFQSFLDSRIRGSDGYGEFFSNLTHVHGLRLVAHLYEKTP
jgi:hypothetical protein